MQIASAIYARTIIYAYSQLPHTAHTHNAKLESTFASSISTKYRSFNVNMHIIKLLFYLA